MVTATMATHIPTINNFKIIAGLLFLGPAYSRTPLVTIIKLILIVSQNMRYKH